MLIGDIVQTKRGEIGKVLEVYENGAFIETGSGAKFTILFDRDMES